MTITTMTSREFNQDVSKAKRSALQGPVFITARGQPAHVLLTVDDYQRISKKKAGVAELLAMPDADNVEFEPGRLSDELFKPVDLS